MLVLSKKNISEAQLIKKTVEFLRSGGLVVAPSDTVYGLLVDATNKEAVRKLINFKNRPIGKAISVFVYDIKQAKEIVKINQKQELLLKKLLPGPFTVVLPSKHQVVKDLESEKGTLGIRIPDFFFINELMRVYQKPVTATSANISGRGPHYSIEDLMKTLSQKKKELIDLIVDFGRLPRNKPSTVIDLSSKTIKTLRRGDLNLLTTDTFITKTPNETKKVAQFIFKKNLLEPLMKKKPLVFLIEGELGVGKTVFVKGLGDFLRIKEIISPSFVVYYEYQISHPQLKRFYHMDFYMLEEEEEFDYLKIEPLLLPGNVIAIEWGEKSSKIFNLIKNKAQLIYVKMNYFSEKERKIEIKSFKNF